MKIGRNVRQFVYTYLCVLANVSSNELCSMSRNGGILLDNSCYVLTASSDVRQQQQQTGVSWFKAVSHCASLGSSLASIDISSTVTVSRLAEYLNSSGVEGQKLWIGLLRRPWVWSQRFDPGNHHHPTSNKFISIGLLRI